MPKIVDHVAMEEIVGMIIKHHSDQQKKEDPKAKRKPVFVSMAKHFTHLNFGVFVYQFNDTVHLAVIDLSLSGWEIRQIIVDPTKTRGTYFGNIIVFTKGGEMLVASECDSSTHTEGGAVYVYRQSEISNLGSWKQTDKLTAPDLNAYAHFGQNMQLAKDNETVFISAPGYNGIYKSQGKVYEFKNEFIESDEELNKLLTEEESKWKLTAEITPELPVEVSYFGEKIVISPKGKRILISAPLYDDVCQNEGRVYSFIFQDGVWMQEAIIESPDKESDQEFGSNIRFLTGGEIFVVGGFHGQEWDFMIKERIEASFSCVRSRGTLAG